MRKTVVSNITLLHAKQQTVLMVATTRHLINVTSAAYDGFTVCNPTWQPPGQLQLSDDAGDGTWQRSQQFILNLNYSNPKLNYPTTAPPTCVNTCSIAAI